jgi:hypothetical protein
MRKIQEMRGRGVAQTCLERDTRHSSAHLSSLRSSPFFTHSPSTRACSKSTSPAFWNGRLPPSQPSCGTCWHPRSPTRRACHWRSWKRLPPRCRPPRRPRTPFRPAWRRPRRLWRPGREVEGVGVGVAATERGGGRRHAIATAAGARALARPTVAATGRGRGRRAGGTGLGRGPLAGIARGGQAGKVTTRAGGSGGGRDRGRASARPGGSAGGRRRRSHRRRPPLPISHPPTWRSCVRRR